MNRSLLSSGRFSLVPGNHSHSPSATYAGVRYSPLSEIASTSLSLGARRRAARRPWKDRSWPHVPHLRPRHTLISTLRRGNDHKELLNLRDRQGALGKHALKKGHGALLWSSAGAKCIRLLQYCRQWHRNGRPKRLVKSWEGAALESAPSPASPFGFAALPMSDTFKPAALYEQKRLDA